METIFDPAEQEMKDFSIGRHNAAEPRHEVLCFLNFGQFGCAELWDFWVEVFDEVSCCS